MSVAANPSSHILSGIGRPRARITRRFFETMLGGTLALSASISVVTTFAIILILAQETWVFFQSPEVSLSEFFFTKTWAPLLGHEKHFGVWPLVAGTMWVAGVAALVAIPLGLVVAIYLSEYAPRRVRAVLKPMLEVLAGVPTVVYGFFALTAITPTLQRLIPGVESYNALSAGLAVGIMCIPIVCSLSEDALQAVPRSLREGAYAVGSTRFDVSVKVVLPAALSGVVASFLLAIARAVGETMIVALAAGGMAQLTMDPRQSVQTITGYMVQIYLGDTAGLGVEHSSTYAVAMVLFAMTLALTLLGHFILVRFREVYE